MRRELTGNAENEVGAPVRSGFRAWRRPRRADVTAAVVLVVAVICGCIPEKRMAWSPDGEQAAVMTNKAIYFIDGDGKVLPARLSLADARCEWFPDGKRLLVRHSVTARKWGEVASLFDEAQTARIKSEAQSLRERILAYQGDWDAFKFEPAEELPPGMVEAVFFYLRDQISEGLPEKLGAKWEDAQKLEAPVNQLQVFAFDKAAISAGQVLLRTLNPVTEVRPSPTGKNVSFLMPAGSGDKQSQSLYVMSAEGGGFRGVAGNVATFYDWSPNGSSLAFIHSNGPPAQKDGVAQLGALATVVVAGPDGALLAEWRDQKDRVGLLFNDQLMVRWLSDERLFFTSVEMRLPATTRDMPQEWSIFAIDPRMPASVIHVLGRDFDQSLLGSPMFFVSPDEKRVLLVGPKNRLTLYDVASEEVTPVTEREEDPKTSRPLPSWRNNSEICFVGLGRAGAEAATQAEVFLWKDGHMRSLSEGWPEEMRGDWMGGGGAASQPATAKAEQ